MGSIFDELEFDSAVDLMSGTASVAYLFKRMGKAVIANDVLRFNYLTSRAFIENADVTLDDDDLNWLLLRHRGHDYPRFVANNFRGYYFTSNENTWLDQTAYNIANLPVDGERGEYKRAIAHHAVVQAALSKRPFNLFHRKNLSLRLADVERRFGNKTTWETDFAVLFERFAREAGSYIFSNGRENEALNLDAAAVRGRADLVYIDPPYFARGRERTRSNYMLLYHFVDDLPPEN
jgi:adenine-specific DNA methylase